MPEQAPTSPSLLAASLSEESLRLWTDMYFTRTREIIDNFGDKHVLYAIFLRRPIVSAPRLLLDWLERVQELRKCKFDIELCYEEGRWVGAGEPLLYIGGSFRELVQLETFILQLVGPPCVAAYNAFIMCSDLPNCAFLAMDARHCAGQEMAELMAYAAYVGSERGKRKSSAKGFIATSSSATSRYFGLAEGAGTMPHALIGYANSTLEAAKMFHKVYPQEILTVLVDYFGLEISDSLEVCRYFRDLANSGRLALRLDTVGGRYCEGLDTSESYAILAESAPEAIRGYRSEAELRHLIGPGVSAAALWHLRRNLLDAGFDKVKIIASSGFTPEKCRVMALAQTPIDVVGTGSFLPDSWRETYATADIVSYDGVSRVKRGREFLLRQNS